jgi:hypothetical protein
MDRTRPRYSVSLDEYGTTEDFADAVRHHFIRALNRFSPKALISLRENVWPIFRENLEVWLLREQKSLGKGEWLGRFGWPNAVRIAIFNWADEFHLTYQEKPPGWILQQIEAQFFHWESDLASQRPPQMLWQYFGSRSPESLPIEDCVIEFPTFRWHPRWDRESRSAARERVLEAIKDFPRLLEERLDQIEDLTRQHYKRLPRKYEEAHFAWAVRFQVNRESVGKIAESIASGEERTVRAAISDVLNHAGLTRRRDKIGRPAKKFGSSRI